MGMKGSGGEIVQVQRGHIVRSTGRKDRHSKVYTAKGPRDRRVRLSAHTAIQFYDVQDRLGYDRPSKAVDWLIKKAKAAIDKLAELPPWHPTPSAADHDLGSDEITIPEQEDSPGYSFQVANSNSAFLPHSMEPFFPTTSASSSMNFQGYPIEDLGLSLHSFQGQSQGNASTVPTSEQTLYSPPVHDGFDTSFPRMGNWSGEESRASVGFALNSMQIEHQQQQEAISLRGTLHPGMLQSFRPWNDLTMASTDHSKSHGFHQPYMFGGREELPGFTMPASIHGHGHGHGQEEQTIVSDTPNSSSPNSHQ